MSSVLSLILATPRDILDGNLQKQENKKKSLGLPRSTMKARFKGNA